jgi:8-oxo-dGTP pyrophosphatase MutT (NUDIX family)
MHGKWHVAVIEPNLINADKITRRAKARPAGTVYALPKGGVDHGETTEEAAVREVWEETGLKAGIIAKLKDVHYYYVRSWGGHERVSKTVSFYLFHYDSGALGQIRPEMKIEVRRAIWIPLSHALNTLTYKGEREAVMLAQRFVSRQHDKLMQAVTELAAPAGTPARPRADNPAKNVT